VLVIAREPESGPALARRFLALASDRSAETTTT
jgi:hypothetical protein